MHHDALAEILVQKIVGRQTDIERYEGLLSRLFATLAGIDLGNEFRAGATTPLMKEAKQLQALRDQILHRGSPCTPDDAKRAFDVAVSIYDLIVVPMIGALGLRVAERGTIKP